MINKNTMEEAERLVISLGSTHPNFKGYVTGLNEIYTALQSRDDEIARLKAEAESDWEDKPLPEDAKIDSYHPVQTKRFDLYDEAMRLVGARYSKHGLCELVNWLLAERDQLRAQADELAEALREIAKGQHLVRLEVIAEQALAKYKSGKASEPRVSA